MKVIINQTAFRQTVVKQARKHIKGFMQAVIAQMRALMRQPKTGRVYRFRGRPHQASAPGEAPAIRSRRLSRAIRDFFADDQTGVIEVDTPYAQHLEYGAPRANLEPRPFARPAIKTVRDQFNRGGLRGVADRS
jgi:hypothetical protein